MGRLALTIVVVAAAACAKGGGNEPPPIDMPPPIDDFVPPDMDNGCAIQPCSILPQCGCASTDACDVDLSDTMGTACRVILAPGQITSTCDAASKCDRGFVCLGGNNSVCKKYCSADADCGSPRGQCVLDITGSGGQPIPDVPTVCSSNCDPVATGTTFCPTNFKCNIFVATHNGQNKNIVDCSPAGAGKQGASCKSNGMGVDSLCAPNFSCTTVDGGTNFNCRHFCDKTANTGCPAGTTCISFNPAFTIKGVEYGVCN